MWATGVGGVGCSVYPSNGFPLLALGNNLLILDNEPSLSSRLQVYTTCNRREV